MGDTCPFSIDNIETQEMYIDPKFEFCKNSLIDYLELLKKKHPHLAAEIEFYVWRLLTRADDLREYCQSLDVELMFVVSMIREIGGWITYENPSKQPKYISLPSWLKRFKRWHPPV